MEKDSAGFGKWRSFFWPVHRWELKKFLPMFFMFFLIAFNYNALHACKDALVVTAPHSGAEAIPFIKVWVILPAAILLTYLFTRLATRFGREKVFYLMMGLFLTFFAFFTFVLFPAQHILHPNSLIDSLQALLPSGFKGFLAIFRNWTFTLFYVMSELWGTAILTVLFWGFANDVLKVHEAKRFYGLLMIGANIAGALAGQAAVWLSSIDYIPSLPYGNCNWDQSILFLNSLIIISGLLTLAIYRWLNTNVIHLSPDYVPAERVPMSMKDTFSYLAKSKYLLCIATIVLSYNVVINLVEVVWKNQIKELYPSPSEYNIFMGETMTFMGIIATVAALATVYLMRRFSWTFNALIPAVITFVTGAAFFLFVLFPHSAVSTFTALIGASPLMINVVLGGLQNSFTRAAKYTLFDATKEIAFIPLSKESKAKGKAAIDGVGSRLGKSGGSLVHQSLLLCFSTVSASTPYVAVIFVIGCVAWIYATMSLGKQFDSLTKPSPQEST